MVKSYEELVEFYNDVVLQEHRGELKDTTDSWGNRQYICFNNSSKIAVEWSGIYGWQLTVMIDLTPGSCFQSLKEYLDEFYTDGTERIALELKDG